MAYVMCTWKYSSLFEAIPKEAHAQYAFVIRIRRACKHLDCDCPLKHDVALDDPICTASTSGLVFVSLSNNARVNETCSVG